MCYYFFLRLKRTAVATTADMIVEAKAMDGANKPSVSTGTQTPPTPGDGGGGDGDVITAASTTAMEPAGNSRLVYP